MSWRIRFTVDNDFRASASTFRVAIDVFRSSSLKSISEINWSTEGFPSPLRRLKKIFVELDSAQVAYTNLIIRNCIFMNNLIRSNWYLFRVDMILKLLIVRIWAIILRLQQMWGLLCVSNVNWRVGENTSSVSLVKIPLFLSFPFSHPTRRISSFFSTLCVPHEVLFLQRNSILRVNPSYNRMYSNTYARRHETHRTESITSSPLTIQMRYRRTALFHDIEQHFRWLRVGKERVRNTGRAW